MCLGLFSEEEIISSDFVNLNKSPWSLLQCTVCATLFPFVKYEKKVVFACDSRIFITLVTKQLSTLKILQSGG